ncbi:recombinase family protein [Chloroflexota bacterium]
MKAAIYCRVSTDNQEREGTSLQTQLENCLTYCQSKGYDVAYRFTESYSGLTIDRPKLSELRELVRTEDIDVVLVYCLDRLTRDPGHGVIITQELEKHHVKLEAVTEDVDNSELGKLISYIRGYASKVEAEKIKERTMRGKRAKAKGGSMPTGNGPGLYGYDYIPVSQKNGGRRVINEIEASWVRKMYQWLVNDGMSTRAITLRLRSSNAPTKCGRFWRWATVLKILKNPAYTGRTFLFTTANGKQYHKPKEDWIEIPDVTPVVISEELFQAAQQQLQENSRKAIRNTRRQYLLRGHVHCRKCGQSYYGCATGDRAGGARRLRLRYRCRGKLSLVSPTTRCVNNSWQADKLEALVWEQIARVLDNPELIIAEIEKQRQDADMAGVLETELKQVDRQLNATDHSQHQLLQWALKGFPEETVVTENNKLNARRESLKAQKTQLEAQIKVSEEAVISLPKLEQFVQFMRERISLLDFEAKRMALDMLNVKVWLDGQNVEITGTIPVSDGVIATTSSQ